MDVQPSTSTTAFNLLLINGSLPNTTVYPDVTSVGVKVTWSNICIAIFATLIIIGTFLGNTMVIAAVLVERRLRKVGNTFIINLAVSDILVGSVVTPMALAFQLTGQWTFGRAVCDIFVSMDVICCTASITNLCAISYDRCNAITQPLRYAGKRTLKRALLLILFIWCYSLCIALPPFLGWRTTPVENGDCQISQDKGYTLYSTVGAFYLPLVLMIFSYVCIYRVTSRRTRQWRRGPGSSKLISDGDRSRDAIDLKLLKSDYHSPPVRRKSRPVFRQVSFQDEQVSLPPRTYGACNESIAEEGGPGETVVEAAIEATPETGTEVSCPPSERSPGTVARAMAAHRSRYSFPKKLIRQISNLPSSDSSTTTSSSTTTNSDQSQEAPLLDKRSSMRSQWRGDRLHSFKMSQDSSTECRKSVHFLTPPPVNGDGSSDEKETVSTDEASRFSVNKKGRRKRKKRISVSQEKRAAKTLSIVIGCFVLCWVPFFLVALISPLCESCQFHPAVIGFVTWMGYCNSALNPIIYTFFNKDFRHAFKKLLCSKKKPPVTL